MANLIPQFSDCLDWLTSVANTIITDRSGLLLIPFTVAIVGAVVGILKRVFSRGKA